MELEEAGPEPGVVLGCSVAGPEVEPGLLSDPFEYSNAFDQIFGY